ncbi:MAG: DegT/DnrJ/EryC1/StrS family aminotransferase [Candidatus Poribacteria bacterium]|nr:DegT/DnrJ/EryC1/StrS family aminotransferase [Candidatus Poribacteria bacterium]
MNQKLAIDGGVPVRENKPWPGWPQVDSEEWETEIEPRMRQVYLSASEGLPGVQSKALGQGYADYTGTKYATFLPHGTDAISAAISGALDLDGFEDGGEIITTNYTFIATASAALDRRCSVAFVDIDPDNFTIDPSAVEAAITSRTRAIMAVHLGGHPANMDALNEIARKHHLKVIEDCAQAHGAESNGEKVGSLGHVGAFSFQSSKNLTSGEGGMVTTNDKNIHNLVHAFMNVGRLPEGARWEYPRLGWNYRPSEYLAALLITRLPKLEDQTDIRNANAAYLSAELKQIQGITPPSRSRWVSKHGYHLYMMRYNPEGFGGKLRGEFLRALSAEGIPSSSGYGQSLSQEGGLQRVASQYPDLIRELPCPNTEQACQESVWLFQNILLGSRQEMDQIIEAIAKIQNAWA